MPLAVPTVSVFQDVISSWGHSVVTAIDEIQSAPWYPLPYNAPWGDWGDITQLGQFRLRGNMVQLRGCVKRNAATTGVVCTLPSGYRPLAPCINAAVMSAPAGHCRVDVGADGTVAVGVGVTLPDAYANLDGISFSVT